MKFRRIFLLNLIVLIFLAACSESSSTCPPGSVTYAEDAGSFSTAETGAAQGGAPVEVEIGRKTLLVDRVIRGPLCNETLQGTVYIACDVQVKKWANQPNFLDGCSFNVAPETVIYVAAHNNAAYYNGCASCHASAASQP